SPGALARTARSEGLSISSAIPGNESTTHGFPVARAAARCGLKLSLPNRNGKRAAGRRKIALVPRPSAAGTSTEPFSGSAQARGNAAHLSRRRLHLFLARLTMSAVRELLRLYLPAIGEFRIVGPPPGSRRTAPTQTQVRVSGIESGRAFTIAVLDQGTSSERVLSVAPFLFEQTG